MVQKHYDYIILGAGLAGYTMALRMARDLFFDLKKIAVIDARFDKGNDRTWCFWETRPDLFEAAVSYRWEEILVKENHLEKPIPIAPYTYKKIEGSDFYAFAKKELSSHSNITLIEDEVIDCKESEGHVLVTAKGANYEALHVLNSFYKPSLLKQQRQAVVLQQHFLGWFVKTNAPVFNPKVATYMDFSVAQRGNCRFMYVLPTSEREALVEYTLFSKDLLPKTEYEAAIKRYLEERGVTDFEIVQKEQGSIPMTTHRFTQHNSNRILHIGTAGGWTKASTGYTFKHTLKKSAGLVSFLKSGKSFRTYDLKNRWTFYDAVLLEVLSKHNALGAPIFTRMFRKGKAGHIFRFLDEESSFGDELKVILSAPKMKFIRAAFRVLFGGKKNG